MYGGYICLYIYTHYSTYFLHLDGIIKQLRSPDYMHVDGPVALENGCVLDLDMQVICLYSSEGCRMLQDVCLDVKGDATTSDAYGKAR